MSNKETLLQILQTASPELTSELNYHINDVEHEDEYSLLEAFEDVSNQTEEFISDTPDPLTKKLWKEIRAIYVSIGYAVPWKKPLLSNGSTVWFTIGKEKFEPIDSTSWESWISK